MRARRVAPLCCAVVLVLAAAPAAFAQDSFGARAATLAAEATPPVEAAAPPEAAPAAEPPADPTPAPAVAAPPDDAAAATAAPVESAATATPAAPAPPAEPAGSPAAADRAEPPPALTRAAPRKGVVRSRPRAAANMSQADVQVSEFGGRVTLRDVEVLGCAGGPCEPSSRAAYEVRDLEVRAEAGEQPLIAVTRATVTGDGSVAARVVIRPPGEAASTGDVTLRAGEDLLAPSVFAGTELEAAYRRLRDSTTTLFGAGGPLERLTIVFGEGTVVKGSFGAVSISAADQLVSVRVPVQVDDQGALVRAGPPFVDRQPTDSARPRVRRQRTSSNALGDDRPSTLPGTGFDEGGRGPVPNGGGEAEEPEPEDEEGGGLFGTIISTCVLGVGACDDDDEEEQVVSFVIDSRSATITIDRSGRGPLEIGCPSGFGDVSGTALIESEIRLGERQRPLSRAAEFTCDGEIIRIEVQLLDAELDRLRDAQGTITARVTVRATAEGGLRAVDFDVVTLELTA